MLLTNRKINVFATKNNLIIKTTPRNKDQNKIY